MPKYQHHFFVCTNTRPPIANPSCGASHGHELFAAMRDAIEKFGWQEKVAVNAVSCLGPCESGPIIVVYPAGVWYGSVRLDDVEEILRSHVLDGKAVERLQLSQEDVKLPK
jgi:(2Fe-2S) ferredoxin